MASPPSRLRLFTWEEAQRQIPAVEVALARARAFALRLGELETRVDAIVAAHGEERVDSPQNPDREAYWRLLAELRDVQARLETSIEEIRFAGAEVKDLAQGLVDFTAQRGEGELVYLCWKLGEPELSWWHPLEGGFAARKPRAEF
ncbi:MAG TPA: DUF2203 domain-containing protein [Candidatus Thermoplasmatota archaeon]|nr:DUF2203 domain-containing protein [Candidatus Thermoplasmatota archaeon]